jgi:hypothetical protein
LPDFALGLFLFEQIDQFDGGEEAYLLTVMFDGLDADGGGDMGLAGARAADQDDVSNAGEPCSISSPTA